MNRYLLFLLSACSVVPVLTAKELTPEQALRRADAIGLETRANSGARELLFTSRLHSGEAAVYVFDNAGKPGYLMLSADDVAAPVVGYADGGKFDPSSIPPQLEWWLSEYGRQIEYAKENGAGEYLSVATRASHDAVAPLLKTLWDQGDPYNKETPAVNGKNTPTGCVATAMAQVMKYWNYPEIGTGVGTITLPGTSQNETMLFSQKAFQWSDMLDSYIGTYTEQQGDAVAYLMKACGYSCDMNYTPTGSGAVSMRAAMGLVNNFKYNKNLQYWSRDYFQASEWEEMIYNELANKRPVLYGGASTSVGHEFVCDGYDGDGYFHFNWGWSGMSDGYFLLDALNPGAVGTGGGDGGGFNFSQDIIINIQPETTEAPAPRLVQMGNLTASAKFTNLVFTLVYGDTRGYWINTGIQSMNVSLGVVFEPVNSTEGGKEYVEIDSGTIAAPTLSKSDKGTSISWKGFQGSASVAIPSSLADGEYKVTVCSKGKDEDNSKYIPVLTDSGYNYVYLTKEGSKYTVVEQDAPELKIAEAGLLSQLYAKTASKFTITIENNTDQELTRSFYPMLLSGDIPQMMAEGLTVTVSPNTSVTKEFTSIFETLDNVAYPSSRQIYQFVWYDPERDEIYDWSEQVTMNVNLAGSTVEVKDFVIPGYEYVERALSDGTVVKFYQINDTMELPFRCTLYNEYGYFGSQAYVAIFPNGGGNSLAMSAFTEIPTIGAGESCTIDASINFASGVEDEIYMAALYYRTDSGFETLGDGIPLFFTFSNSSVDEISLDNGVLKLNYDPAISEISVSSVNGVAVVEVYSLDGRKAGVDVVIDGNNASMDLSSLPKGIFVVRAVDGKGIQKTLKISR